MVDMSLDELRAEAHRAAELMRVQRAEEAETLLRALLARNQSPELHFRLAMTLLMQGRLREGFGEIEGRRTRQQLLKTMKLPELDGQIAGRSIIVFGEQGLGDEVQFSRFVPLLRELGAGHITFACHRTNMRAFAQLGADAIADRENPEIVVPKETSWVALWSLPYRLGVRPDEITGAPYLTAEPCGEGGIGLVERGNPLYPYDASRSVPVGALQAAVPSGRLLEPRGDLQESLSQVAALDLLITVDTSWAHIAGALGVPCWLLLPHDGLDWRWMRSRRDTPWYRSLRLFRQPRAGDWASVIAEVREELRGLL